MHGIPMHQNNSPVRDAIFIRLNTCKFNEELEATKPASHPVPGGVIFPARVNAMLPRDTQVLHMRVVKKYQQCH